MAKQTKRPVYTRWWFWALAVLLVIGMVSRMTGHSPDTEGSVPSTEPTDITSTTVPQTPPTETSVPSEEPDRLTIDTFIDTLNATAGLSISDIVEMDIRGEDYKTEFRLGAFKNAIGKKGAVTGGTIEIVSYGTWSNDSLRVYAYVSTLDAATELYTAVVKTMDATLSSDTIAAQYEGLTNTDSVNITLGPISGYISADYADGSIAGYDIMLDRP